MSDRSLFCFQALFVAVAIAYSCTPAATPTVDTLPNFHDVGGGVYRSAQLTTLEQWQRAHDDFHIRHVVKLNADNEGSDALALAVGIEVWRMPVQPIGDQDLFDDVLGTFVEPDPATFDEAERLLAQATPEDAWLVHCTHGQDRTGREVGELRVKRDHWSCARAWDEAVGIGYHVELLGLDASWRHFCEREGAGVPHLETRVSR